MRAIVFDRYGEPNVMSLRDVPVPEPQHDEVLVRGGHAGVNPSDTKARSGQSARAVCQAVRDWSTEGVDVVLDAVGSATLPQALDMLRPAGRLVNVSQRQQTVILSAIGRKLRDEASTRSFS